MATATTTHHAPQSVLDISVTSGEEHEGQNRHAFILGNKNK